MLWKRFVLVVTAALVLTAAMTACNTMRGLGKDVERGGEKLQDATK